MPAPITFDVKMAALPPGFSGDPQALGTAFAERLIISPSDPWSSFINGGAQPSSNVGPWLRNGNEWWVWSDALGSYTYHSQNGAGVQAGTLPISALNGAASPKTVLIFDAAGNPVAISGVPGQVVTADVSGVPVFTFPATGSYFTVRLSVDQTYTSNNTPVPVKFDNIGACQNVSPDVAGYRIPVPANSVWYFRVSAQIEHINGVTPDWEHFLSIRPYQSNALVLTGGTTGAVTAGIARSFVPASGLYAFSGAGFVDVAVSSTSSITGPQFAVSNNGGSTIFSGFRLY